MNKTGILIVNLGTPKEATARSIRQYLKEFLADPRVIDIPKVFRFLLLYLFILPFRPKKIRSYYQKIWTHEGSPLLLYSKKIAGLLRKDLDREKFTVSLGMRYGEPSLEHALSQLKDCERIKVLPLYPQYATSSTGSCLARLYELNAKNWDPKPFDILLNFYNDPDFIRAYAALISSYLSDFAGHLLFSFHSIPVRHLSKSGCAEKCAAAHGDVSCKQQSTTKSYCYKFQSYETARLIAEKIGLSSENYSVAFQSRLGRTPWIKPYTDEWLLDLYARGVRKLAIASPSFVVDCLETIDEIGNRLSLQWKNLGGIEFIAIPCLNDSKEFVDMLIKYAHKESL